MLGGNYRMTEFQAALLLDQLRNADEQLAQRERNAEVLDSGLRDVDGLTPLTPAAWCTRHGYHLYQLRYDATGFDGLPRERFVEALSAEGIPASLGYGRPLNQQLVFSRQVFDKRATGYDPAYPPTRYGDLDLPRTEQLCREAIWIPQNVLLGDRTDMEDVLAAITKVRASAAALR